jgi:hypothetical protein
MLWTQSRSMSIPGRISRSRTVLWKRWCASDQRTNRNAALQSLGKRDCQRAVPVITPSKSPSLVHGARLEALIAEVAGRPQNSCVVLQVEQVQAQLGSASVPARITVPGTQRGIMVHCLMAFTGTRFVNAMAPRNQQTLHSDAQAPAATSERRSTSDDICITTKRPRLAQVAMSDQAGSSAQLPTAPAPGSAQRDGDAERCITRSMGRSAQRHRAASLARRLQRRCAGRPLCPRGSCAH